MAYRKLPALEAPPPDWCAWAAGIVDGEGCIQLIRHNSKTKNPRWGIRLSVGNTDPRMLTKLRDMFGGTIWFNKRVIANHRPFWNWQVASQQAEMVLRLILPWLIAKQDQAQIALESRSMMKLGRRWAPYSKDDISKFDTLVAEMKTAKKRDFLETVS